MGHKEIFMSFSKDDRGFWVRYLLSKKYEVVPSVSLSAFTENSAEGNRNIYKGGRYANSKNRVMIIGNNFIDLNTNEAIGNGEDRAFDFDLHWTKEDAKVNAISGLERILDLRSRYILFAPLSSFEGHLKYSGRDYDIDGYNGMVGYISQPDYLRRWTWAHMSGSEEDEHMWADALVTDIKFRGGNVALFSAGIYGDLVKTYLMPLVFYGIADISGIQGYIKKGGELIYLHADLDPRKTIKAKYDAVKESGRFCYNSEMADISLHYRGREFTSKSGFLEHGTYENFGGFEEVEDKVIDRPTF